MADFIFQNPSDNAIDLLQNKISQEVLCYLNHISSVKQLISHLPIRENMGNDVKKNMSSKPIDSSPNNFRSEIAAFRNEKLFCRRSSFRF